jgi:ribosomal-protein-alanine N-acetyltransferase
VRAIDEASFPRPWPAAAYEHELAKDDAAAVWLVARVAPQGGARRSVAGFGGLWIAADEGHICQLAVGPAWRRRGIGGALVRALMVEAVARMCAFVTLEVRASNVAAQRLYERFGFAAAGVRRGYYSDNGEDALILTTPPLSETWWQATSGPR